MNGLMFIIVCCILYYLLFVLPGQMDKRDMEKHLKREDEIQRRVDYEVDRRMREMQSDQERKQ